MHTPSRLNNYLRFHADAYPSAWKQFEMFRAMRGKGLPVWPAWCYCPLAAAYAIVSGGGSNRVPLGRVQDVGILAALGAWRMGKGIYQFDPSLLTALLDTPLDGNLPTAVIYSLPEWCVYIDLSGASVPWGDDTLSGFFAHLEADATNGRHELRLVLDMADRLVPLPLHLCADTLDECVASALVEAERQAALQGINAHTGIGTHAVTRAVAPLVSVLLYLCTEAADMADHAGKKYKPSKPTYKKIKGCLRMFPAEAPTTWDVGYRIGAKLRAAEAADRITPQGETHASPRAHVRRAHWHSFWKGSKKNTNERTAVARWLPPIPVGLGETVPTIHKIKEE